MQTPPLALDYALIDQDPEALRARIRRIVAWAASAYGIAGVMQRLLYAVPGAAIPTGILSRLATPEGLLFLAATVPGAIAFVGFIVGGSLLLRDRPLATRVLRISAILCLLYLIGYTAANVFSLSRAQVTLPGGYFYMVWMGAIANSIAPVMFALLPAQRPRTR